MDDYGDLACTIVNLNFFFMIPRIFFSFRVFFAVVARLIIKTYYY